MGSEQFNCPQCGSSNVAAIMYGLPDFNDELERELEAGRVVLGGCVISGEDPKWQCNECEHQWGSLEFGH